MDGQAKVNLILEPKERIRGELAKAKVLVNTDVQEMKNRLCEL